MPAGAISAITELEEIAQAFFFLDPKSFMGVTIHPSYDKESSHLPVAVRAAINKLESVTMYWSAYANEVEAGRLGAAPDTDRNVLEVGPHNDIQVIYDPDKINDIAESEGREKGTYQSRILRTNWIGDGDFWGSWQPSIFPMRVQVSGSVYDNTAQFAQVPRETLGISPELEVRAWESWIKVFAELEVLHLEAIKDLFNQKAFYSMIQVVVGEALDKGEDLSRPFKLAQLVYKGALFNGNDYSVIDEAIVNAIATTGAHMAEKVLNSETSSDLPGASKALAANLREMLELARDSQGE